MSVSDQQVKSQFWSIERAVAFVVAPIATPASGAAALWLGAHFPGLHVSGPAIYAYAATVSGGVAASFIKWLDGRSKFTNMVAAAETNAMHAASPLIAAIPEHERKSLLADIKGLVSSEVAKVAKHIPGGEPASAAPSAAASPDVGVLTPEPEPDPWATPNDPAPGTAAPLGAPPQGVDPAPPGPSPSPAPAAAESGAAIAGS